MNTIEPNLGFANYAIGREYQLIGAVQLAEKSFKTAADYLPKSSFYNDAVKKQIAQIDNLKKSKG